MISDRSSLERQGEVTLDGIRAMWRYRYHVLLTAVSSAIATAAFSLFLTPIYRAEVVVRELQVRGISTGSVRVGELGAVGSVADSGLLAEEPRDVAQEILKSHRLAEDFVLHEDLLPSLVPHGDVNALLSEAVRRFREHVLSVEDDPVTRTTTIAIEWSNPATAARLANSYVDFANASIRQSALADSRHSIDYLKEEASRTRLLPMRNDLYDALQAETEVLMLASAQKEYAFDVVDPAMTPGLRTRPKRSLMVALGASTGLFGSIAAVFTWCAFRSGVRQRASSTPDYPYVQR